MSSERKDAAPPPRLQVSQVGRRFGVIQALDAVDLSILPGEIHAVCGHNGAGKSTLVKILSGIERPDEGTIAIDGEEVSFRNPQHAQEGGIALVDQEISLIPALSVADNILLGRRSAPFFHRPGSSNSFVRQQLARVGLDQLSPGTPVARLSLGEQQLVEIARALSRDARLVILDEPTATLTEAETEFVFTALRALAATGTSIIFVSHRLGEVLSLCDRVTVLRDGGVVGTAAVEPQLDRSALVNMMLGDVLDDEVVPQARVGGGSRSLHVRGLTVPSRLYGLDLDVEAGQIVALAGQLGSGASECLRALAGLIPGSYGAITVNDKRLTPGSPIRAQRAGLIYLSGDRKAEGLFLERSAGRNLIATRLGSVSRAGLLRRRLAARTESTLATVVGLEARRRDPVLTLSGGNQQKAFIGRSLQRSSAGVLLLDEPTRGVDVGGRADIHALIRGAAEAGNAVVYASTEGDEILDLADTVVTLCAGKLVSVRPRAEVTLSKLVAEMTHPEAAHG